MRPSFHAELTNRTFGDPGVYLDLKFERRALLFDIGDVSTLSTRKLLRITDVFVSHMHMDHFCGVDHLLRVCLGRGRRIKFYGPAGLIAQLEHKLAAYTWNLVHNYATEFIVVAHEWDGGAQLQVARFRSRNRFLRELLPEEEVRDGVLMNDPQFLLRALPLQHHDITTLAFAFQEGVHLNVLKSRLEGLQLPTGPWLTELKRQVRVGAPDDMPIRIRWRTREGAREQMLPLGQLRREVLQIVPGQKVCYVTDMADTVHNRTALAGFLRNADLVFIEAVFLNRDREMAERKGHLTAGAAGEIVRQAGARRAVPFHFSPRYLGREDELQREFLGLSLPGENPAAAT